MKNIAPALNITWTLRQDGQTIKTGSSATAVGGSYTNETVENELAGFDGKRGHRYVLEWIFWQMAQRYPSRARNSGSAWMGPFMKVSSSWNCSSLLGLSLAASSAA
jgi:hypothetical protein